MKASQGNLFIGGLKSADKDNLQKYSIQAVISVGKFNLNFENVFSKFQFNKLECRCVFNRDK
jgi:hypothetical protein